MNDRELAVLARAAESGPAERKIYADALEESGNAEGARFQRLLAERRRYYIEYPRNFANEYDVYVVPASLAGHFEAAFPDAARITRKRAVERGWVRPREAKRDNEQWYGGFVEDRAYRGAFPATPGAALDLACRATIEELEAREDDGDA